LKKHTIDETPEGFRRSLGEELLEPTRIYVKPTRELRRRVEVHGLAHITGGSFSKLERIVGEAKLGVEIDQLPPPPEIFQLIQREGHISDLEMYQTFNMGVGLAIVCTEAESDQVIRVFKRHGQDSILIGRVTKRPGIRINGRPLN